MTSKQYDNKILPDVHFPSTYIRSIDEDYYKRAVDYYRINSSTFVYSVPIDAGRSEGISVTGSRAIFIGSNKQRAPAAVVGVQYDHRIFADRFFNHTEKCGQKECKIKCRSETTDCLLIDNNGFIIVAEDDSFTGKHLSEYDYELLRDLSSGKNARLIRKKVLDYQAMCIDEWTVSGPASFLFTPFDLLRKSIVFLWSKFTIFALDVYLNGILNTIQTFAQEITTQATTISKNGVVLKFEGEIPIIKSQTKSKVRPCVREHELFEVNHNWVQSDITYAKRYYKCGSTSSNCQP